MHAYEHPTPRRHPPASSLNNDPRRADDLYGRALVVIAAEQHASRLVLPASQRIPNIRWDSHKDIAAKALRKLTGPHVPASLTKLERAVKRTHAAYDNAERQAHKRRRADLAASAEPREDLADAGLSAVAILAGSFGAFFHRRGDERDPPDRPGDRELGRIQITRSSRSGQRTHR